MSSPVGLCVQAFVAHKLGVLSILVDATLCIRVCDRSECSRPCLLFKYLFCIRIIWRLGAEVVCIGACLKRIPV